MQWYFKPLPLDEANPDRETGPISFRDLTALVRSGAITEDNLVRTEFSKNWQHADTVVGLFYMSRRAAPVEPEAPPGPAAKSADTPLPYDEPTTNETEFEQPGWMKRLVGLVRAKPVLRIHPKPHDPDRQRQSGPLRPPLLSKGGAGGGHRAINSIHFANPPAIAPLDAPLAPARTSATASPVNATSSPAVNNSCADHDLGDDMAPLEHSAPSAPSNPAAWSAAVDAALSATDGRANAHAGKTARRLWGIGAKHTHSTAAAPWTHRFAPRAFRIGAAFICANLALWWVLDWSAREALRFPDPRATHQFFPFLGPCTPTEYAMLLFDLVLFVALAAYASASWLESHAEAS